MKKARMISRFVICSRLKNSWVTCMCSNSANQDEWRPTEKKHVKIKNAVLK